MMPRALGRGGHQEVKAALVPRAEPAPSPQPAAGATKVWVVRVIAQVDPNLGLDEAHLEHQGKKEKDTMKMKRPDSNWFKLQRGFMLTTFCRIYVACDIAI